MARRKTKALALPAQAGKDIKAVTGILDRWSAGVEDIMKEVFDWGKKHKFLVAVVIGLVLMKRYWLDEESDTDEEYD